MPYTGGWKIDNLPTNAYYSGEVLEPESSVTRASHVVEEDRNLSSGNVATDEQLENIKEKVSLSAQSGSSSFTEGMWAFEWRPTIQVGLVKIPYEKILADRVQGDSYDSSSEFLLNILSVQYDRIDKLVVDSSKIIMLPMNTDNLVILEDVSLSRKLISNTTITQGSKYYQVFTEGFPEVSVTLSVVKFGGISERVIKFFDMITSFSANPRKNPGSFYLYDVFKEQQEGFTSGLFYENAYKKYKIIPTAINKSVTSKDNMMVRITLKGTVVEWEQDE